jgi:transporter family-2 protein
MSGGVAVAVVLSAIAGLAGAVQLAVMGELGTRVGVLSALAFSGAVTLALALAALLLFGRGLGGLADVAREPPWLWTGGVFSLVIILAFTLSAPRIGTTATIALIITGNVLMGTAIDRFGLLGVDAIPLAWPRVVGIALLAVGAALSLYRP